MKYLKVLAVALSMPSLIIGASLFFLKLKEMKLIGTELTIFFIAITIISNLWLVIKISLSKKQ